jgi:hypothetical protein
MKLTYATCQEILAKRDSKKLANNTYLYRSDDLFCVKLHNTDVITIHDDNTQTLHSGGYVTKTTKDRLNTFSYASIFQKRGLWFIEQGEEQVAFFDGVKLNMFGEVVPGETSPPDVKELLARKTILDHKVKKYIDGFVKDAVENGLGAPELGDCLFCQMYAQNPERIAEHDFEHIFSHIEEGYYVRSFLLMAIKSRGYNNVGFIWNYHSDRIVRGDGEYLRDELVGFFKKYKSKLLQFID